MIFAAIACVLLCLAWLLARRPPTTAPDRIPEADPSSPTTPIVDTPLARMAVHEAGHGLAALRCTLVLQVYRIEINEWKGRVEHSMIQIHPDWMWCELVIALSGIAAEAMVFGKFRSIEAATDLTKARGLATEIVATRRKCPAGLRASTWGVRFSEMFVDPPSEKELRVLQIAYDAARSLLVRRVGDHGYLTAMMLSHRTVSSAELTRWFGPRHFLHAAGIFGRGTFV